MRQITVRGIPKEIGKRIQQEAKEKSISLNRAVIAILSQAIQPQVEPDKPSPQKGPRQLDRFCGAWNKAEADSFDRNLNRQRSIDEALWKQKV